MGQGSAQNSLQPNSLLRNLGESAKAGKKKKEKGGEEEERHQNRPAYFPTFLLL